MFFDTKEKMTTKAAAAYLKIAESTIHKYVKEGAPYSSNAVM
ncbi:hypothetical protein AALF16_24215 [Bacillus cereus]